MCKLNSRSNIVLIVILYDFSGGIQRSDEHGMTVGKATKAEETY